ncbi:LsmAD domain-containing protein [Gilbertella persicaria]|uniref:LsmAD domain-containing protein n=1 Tax=Gilbertella persicaria TaxID=101096 RepID=UPI0022205ECF|nr:LsmAD domain-containing protein [Gilbertella persicaria]KAI8047158.1 LsmAD domain-containing protein [Gilbertella persicaria]
MSFSSKSQGKKQEGSHNTNKSRGNITNNNKKWSNTNNNNNNNSTTSNRNHASSHHEFAQDPVTVKLMHDRMLFLLSSLTGTLVEATVKDGTKFRGIFHGASTEGDLGIALKLAQKVHDPMDKTTPVKNTFLIFSKDLVELNAADMDINTQSPQDRNTFKTDTDISGKLDIKERELRKWAPSVGDETNALGLLEDDTGGSWDQFAANEKLFGLKTDFDEEIYTTPLNRSAPGFKDREKRAIRVANEIQKSTTNNVHMLEERGVAIDDSGMDEEDLYGAVVRDINPNKYVPPALRKQLQKKEASDLPKATGSNPSPIAHLPTTRRESGENPTASSPPKRIEAEIATTFRHFAMMEKDKLHAKKQALQKKEKDGRLAELKAFHQSFKLNVPIPADLVPLLSKGKKPVEPTDPVEKKKEPAKKPTAPPSPNTTTASSFKFNVKASSFKPNPTAAAFVPSTVTEEKKKPNAHLTMTEAFTPCFVDKPTAVGPTWPFGHKSYRIQFSQLVYEEDIFTGYPSPNYTYAYPPYRYPQYVPGMPQPYPQFVQNVPISAPMPPSGAPPSVAYSPQMTNVSPHGSPFPQGFPSPQRSPMVPQAMPPQIYQYQGGPVMMRYPPDMMQANGAPPVMMQRPVMVESVPYSPHLQHDSPTTDSGGANTPPSS